MLRTVDRMQFRDELVQAFRHDQKVSSSASECVRNTGWSEDGSASVRDKHAVGEPKPQRARDHVPGFVIGVMHVQRRYFGIIFAAPSVHLCHHESWPAPADLD